LKKPQQEVTHNNLSGLGFILEGKHVRPHGVVWIIPTREHICVFILGRVVISVGVLLLLGSVSILLSLSKQKLEANSF
jgi:hypothetical protein